LTIVAFVRPELPLGHFVIGMPKLAPGLTPSRQRAVTVLIRV
jgi:hypothetical protein